MKEPLTKRITDLLAQLDKVTKTAKKCHKSLSGDNYYGNEFEKLRADLIQEKRALETEAASIGLTDLKQATQQLNPLFETLLNPKIQQADRIHAKKQVLFILRTQIEFHTKERKTGKIPLTDAVIPMSIVSGTRGYIERIAIQANGCYEAGWFDGCAVMVRRLIETLIIECFEHFKIENKIKEKDGNFMHLKELVENCLKETSWTLGRNTKKALPKLKLFGDLSAHNRRFLAAKSDIDGIRDHARITIEEFIHIARLK